MASLNFGPSVGASSNFTGSTVEAAGLNVAVTDAGTAGLSIDSSPSGFNLIAKLVAGVGHLGSTNGTQLNIKTNNVMRIVVPSGSSLMQIASDAAWNWTNGTADVGTADTGLARAAAGVVKVTNGSSGGGVLELLERTAPSGAANTARLYAVDDGGKTKLYVIFGSGAAQLLATEP
jgi:hypothetical protein